MIKLICTIFKKEYLEKPYRVNVSKYCSQKCYGLSERGRIPKSAFKKGQHPSPKTEFKKGNIPQHFGKKRPGIGGNPNFLPEDMHINWKGDDVGYLGLHVWVKKKLGQPDTCEHCGESGLTGNQIHWANKDHQYRRNLTDWLRLCKQCHINYDKENNLNHQK